MMDLVTLSLSDFYLEVHVAQGRKRQDAQKVRLLKYGNLQSATIRPTFIKPSVCTTEGRGLHSEKIAQKLHIFH